ncbi:MAG: helix-turn-helix transcriptional regulator [Pseudomonadota bacterium]|jgi:predicted DNA-binding transcriptional regulator YafY
MDQPERVRKIARLLERPQGASMTQLIAAVERSRATVNRDLLYLRDRLNARIEWDRDEGVYRLLANDGVGPRFELPGLWVNEHELLALLTMQRLVAELQPGLLGSQTGPLAQLLDRLLARSGHSTQEVIHRVRVLTMGARRADSEHFQTVSAGLLDRRQLQIGYVARGSGERTQRRVSPQRLVHYRDNWYLDAWCHLREGLRSFALDAMDAVQRTDVRAKDVAERELDRVLGSGYGIFSGEATRIARLRFSPQRARWVAQETWHPQQRGVREADGSWLLEVPYSNDPELVMDILRYGPDVEVLEPADLRQTVAARLREASRLYG